MNKKLYIYIVQDAGIFWNSHESKVIFCLTYEDESRKIYS